MKCEKTADQMFDYGKKRISGGMEWPPSNIIAQALIISTKIKKKSRSTLN